MFFGFFWQTSRNITDIVIVYIVNWSRSSSDRVAQPLFQVFTVAGPTRNTFRRLTSSRVLQLATVLPQPRHTRPHRRRGSPIRSYSTLPQRRHMRPHRHGSPIRSCSTRRGRPHITVYCLPNRIDSSTRCIRAASIWANRIIRTLDTAVVRWQRTMARTDSKRRPLTRRRLSHMPVYYHRTVVVTSSGAGTHAMRTAKHRLAVLTDTRTHTSSRRRRTCPIRTPPGATRERRRCRVSQAVLGRRPMASCRTWIGGLSSINSSWGDNSLTSVR